MTPSETPRRLLLDTRAFLWWRARSPRLTQDVVALIGAADEVFVSLVTPWEIAIKVSTGRLRVPGRVANAVRDSGFSTLPITYQHAEEVALLPRHHGDPFDRMLIAQARHEQLTLVTHDRAFEAYAVPVAWT